MGNIIKTIGAAAIVAGVTVFTGGAFAGGAFSLASGLSAMTFSAIATTAAIQFGLGAILSKLQPQPSIAGMRGALVTQRDPVASRKVVYGKRRVGGTPVAIATTGAENKFLYSVIALAGHEVESIEELYFNEERVYSWNGSSYVKDTNASYYDAGDSELFNVGFYLGTDSQPADANLVSTFSEWTTDHRLRGIAYVVVQLKYNAEKYSSGVPNITALVKGKKVYDPRTATTTWSDNAVLCLADYLLDDEYGLGASASEFDVTQWSDAADICDESVALDGGGSESRYALNGVIDTSNSPKQIIEEMLLSMGGKLVYANGKFNIIPAEYKTPSVSIDEDDIISDITVTTKNPSKDMYNGVKGVFANPDAMYQPTEYPVVESTTYQADDGVVRYTDLNLPYTTSSATAQRLAKILLNKSRQETTIKMRCNLNALNVMVGDNINVTNSRFGWTNKVFEVGSFSLSPDADGTIGIDIMAREVSSSTYSWTATDEEAIIDNDSLYENNTDVPAPTNLSLSSSIVTLESREQFIKVVLSWTASDARNLLHYEVQWKKSSDSTYQSTTTLNTSLEGGGVEANVAYDARVRAVATSGAYSDWLEGSFTTVTGMVTKLRSGDAASDVNANSTTINGGKITTGTLEANRITSGSLNSNAYWDIGGNYTIASTTISNFFLTGGNSTNIAFGVSTIAGDALVAQTTDAVYTGKYAGSFLNSTSALGSTHNTYAQLGGDSYAGYFSGDVVVTGTVNPFTGSHVCLTTSTLQQGDIVVDTGTVNKIDVSNVVGEVSISTTTNEKAALGVYVKSITKDSLISQYDSSGPFSGIDATGKTFCQINAVGEGQINVCDEGGSIAVGDLIVTSSIDGKGMKQSDDIVRNYTVAKARESATFSSDTEIKQIACVYLCG
mgnify:CR=1 FL=1